MANQKIISVIPKIISFRVKVNTTRRWPMTNEINDNRIFFIYTPIGSLDKISVQNAFLLINSPKISKYFTFCKKHQFLYMPFEDYLVLYRIFFRRVLQLGVPNKKGYEQDEERYYVQ